MRNKYRLQFTSKNESKEKFTLEFQLDHQRIEWITVYQHTVDAFCEVKATNQVAQSVHATVKSILNYLSFDIDIIIIPTGAEVFVVEKIITLINHTPNLHPCN